MTGDAKSKSKCYVLSAVTHSSLWCPMIQRTPADSVSGVRQGRIKDDDDDDDVAIVRTGGTYARARRRSPRVVLHA